MRFMFWKASTFNQDLSCWSVSDNANLEWMFGDADSFTSNLNAWPNTGQDLKLHSNFPDNCAPGETGCDLPSCSHTPSLTVIATTQPAKVELRPTDASSDTADDSYVLPLALGLGAAGICIIGIFLYQRQKKTEVTSSHLKVQL